MSRRGRPRTEAERTAVRLYSVGEPTGAGLTIALGLPERETVRARTEHAEDVISKIFDHTDQDTRRRGKRA